MLSTLRLELKADNLDYKKSSNLQGVMFEHISPDYADMLHQQTMHPPIQPVF